MMTTMVASKNAMNFLQHDICYFYQIIEKKSLSKKKINAEGYDSVFTKGGADLINNEYIVYDIAQTTIRFIVEIT